MSVELLSILVLCAIFLLATVFPIHMGALAIAAAFVFGMFVLPGDFDAKVDQIVGGFPGDLFVVLAGVTYLFAIAKNNGTIDWLVHAAMRSVRGRVALMPWVMFFVTAALTARRRGRARSGRDDRSDRHRLRVTPPRSTPCSWG